MVERIRLLVLIAGAVAWLAVLPACTTTHAASALNQPTFNALFDEVMTRYQLPGMAVGIVEGGRVTHIRMAGELVAGSGQRVNADSIFKIASNSKAMTTGVLARLVDTGKLRWTDPVVRYLPHFRMYDPWVTREMQVRDLLIHNSGLREGAGDLMLWPEPNLFTRQDIIAGLAHLKPLHSFRSRYAYDNLLYIVAGEVAAAAAGMSYEELVRRELFEPLQMNRCQVGEWRLAAVGNVAQPHMRQGERNVPIRRDDDVVPASTSAAAGGIRCSLNDMLKWVRLWLDPDLQLAGARPEPPSSDRAHASGTLTASSDRYARRGTQRAWISTAQRDVLWKAHMPLPLSRRQREWDNSRFHAYGLGWRLSDVDGVLKVAHTGTLTGMYSAVTLLPEKQAGFVILINGDGSEARNALNQILTKLFTAPQAVRPLTYYADDLARERALRTQQVTVSLPDRKPATPASLSTWLGVYRDPWFGEISLCEQAGRVELRSAKSPRLTGTVMQAGDRFLVDWLDDSVDVEPWLDFAPSMLVLTKVDPDADFSYDYEDLSPTRVRGCGVTG